MLARNKCVLSLLYFPIPILRPLFSLLFLNLIPSPLTLPLSLSQPVQSLADRYARRLKKQGSIPDNIDATREERDPSAEPEASFVLQADALQVGQSLFHSTLEPGMET